MLALPALTLTLGLLSGCAAAVDGPVDASSHSQSASAGASGSPGPSTSSSPPETPTAEASAPPSPTQGSRTDNPNDPDDGVARDPQLAASTQPGENGRITAQLQITTWSASRPFKAAGFVPGVIEDGGTCTLTLTQGATRLSAFGTAAPNATNTVCAQGLIVDDERLTAGEWNMQLTYSSARYQATSDILKVQVN